MRRFRIYIDEGLQKSGGEMDVCNAKKRKIRVPAIDHAPRDKYALNAHFVLVSLRFSPKPSLFFITKIQTEVN